MHTLKNSLSRAKAAAHLAQQAVARWRDSATPDASPQARWHEQVNRDFVAWLDAGGFKAVPPVPAKTAALRRCSQPRDGATDEELKFTLLRMNDAAK
ncbi:hypothetical protein ACLB1G_14300 [Oxalobacteraceae bacterium A2-2]